MECCGVLSSPIFSVSTYYSNVVVKDRSGTGGMRLMALLESVAIALMKIVDAADRGMVGIQC